MDPVTAVTLNDTSALLGLVQGFASAAEKGNYWWVSATVVYLLVEVLRGKIPGTNKPLPFIPVVLAPHLSGNAIKMVVLVANILMAGIYLLAGVPVDNAVASAATGWLASMGIHDAVGLKSLVFKPSSKV